MSLALGLTHAYLHAYLQHPMQLQRPGCTAMCPSSQTMGARITIPNEEQLSKYHERKQGWHCQNQPLGFVGHRRRSWQRTLHSDPDYSDVLISEDGLTCQPTPGNNFGDVQKMQLGSDLVPALKL